MSVFGWVRNEWLSLLKNKKLVIAIFVILFVPSLYSCTYLWANWDPYAHLDKMPVAVVNEDVRVDYKGSTYAVGDELVEQLKRDKSFNWDFVSKNAAESGLKNNHYYFEIYIPRDFLKRATTLTAQKPAPLNLYYKVNAGNNFIASQIGRNAVDKIRTNLSQSLSKNYAEVVFGQITSVGKGLADASNGSNRITEGLKDLSNGTQDIVDGMEKQTKR